MCLCLLFEVLKFKCLKCLKHKTQSFNSWLTCTWATKQVQCIICSSSKLGPATYYSGTNRISLKLTNQKWSLIVSGLPNFICALIKPQWVEPQRHVVVKTWLLCVSVRLSRFSTMLKNKVLKLVLQVTHTQFSWKNTEQILIQSFFYWLIAWCSPQQLLPAIQSPAKNKSLTTHCL